MPTSLVTSVYRRLVRSVVQSLSSLPSPREKADTLIRYAHLHGIGTLVETGTYQGATVAACLAHFERVYTVELDPALHEAARDRFIDEPSVTVIHGDSYQALARLASDVTDPALFWLDAHYSAGETARGPHDPPLPWELRAVVGRLEHDVILIDDARLMGVEPGYPSIEEIRQLVGQRASSFEVSRDIIRITLT